MDRLSPITLITGAASGVGAACARDLARRSLGGLVLVDSDEAALSRTADMLDRLQVAPERVSTLAFDVADQERWRQARDFITAQYGRLDWAVVNAGVAHSSMIAETELVDWKRDTSTNLDAAFLSLRAIIPLIGANTLSGSIVVTAPASAISNGGNVPLAANAGLLEFMRVAAKTGAAEDVCVNAVAIGGGSAPNWAAMPRFRDLVRETGSPNAALEKIATLSPPCARYAAADDIAKLIMALLSDDSPTTGVTLVVDGGYTL